MDPSLPDCRRELRNARYHRGVNLPRQQLPVKAPADTFDVPPRIVAVVATHGPRGVPLVRRAVESLVRQTGPFSLAVVVVDDGSGPDVTRLLAAQLPPQVELVELPANGGYGAACNVGVRRALDTGSAYVWLLNNDIEMEDGTLARLVAALERRPRLAAAGPVMISADLPPRVLGAGMTVHLMRGRVRHLHEGAPLGQLPVEPFGVAGIEGSALLIRAAALREVGGMDERYWMYWEDVDWSVRARRAGWQLAIVPKARVRHLVAQSTSRERRTEMLILNRIRFVELVGSSSDRLVFRLYFLVGWLPAYTMFRLVPRMGLVPALALAARAARAAWTPSGFR